MEATKLNSKNAAYLRGAGYTAVMSKIVLDITVDHKLNANQESGTFGKKAYWNTQTKIPF